MSRERGFEGEYTARRYLDSKYWFIVQQNVFSKFGEIDIVAFDTQGYCVFCEVKAYKPNALVDPLYSITAKKRKNLLLTARYFLMKNQQYTHKDCRFDLIIVENDTVINHIEDIIHTN